MKKAKAVITYELLSDLMQLYSKDVKLENILINPHTHEITLNLSGEGLPDGKKDQPVKLSYQRVLDPATQSGVYLDSITVSDKS